MLVIFVKRKTVLHFTCYTPTHCGHWSPSFVFV